jgi:dipeptidyl aminopeptidase/acylaminoacyl peptidase
MTCWLTTQDSRFGAAISVGPATNHVSHHLLGNIPQFDSLFLQDHYTNLSGSYYTRSPLLYAHRSTTPTLLVCGDLDRCTPPEEALQFHHALLENGVVSVVVRYPQEGHGVHAMPAAADFAARSVMWLESHIPAQISNGSL